MTGKVVIQEFFKVIKQNRALSLVCFAATIMVIYFLYEKAIPKLIVSPEVYGDYYWPKAPWLFAHVVSGLIATLIGPFQFIKPLRTKYRNTHRRLGVVYIICILIAAITAVDLAIDSPYNLMGKLSLLAVPFIWLSTVSMAYVSVQKSRMSQHREWMARSYVVTLFFIIFVTVDEYLPYQYFGTYAETLPFLTWVSWSIPLFVTELFIQGRKITN